MSGEKKNSRWTYLEICNIVFKKLIIKMKTWCVKDHLTGNIFKVILTQEELDNFFQKNPNISECIDCIECEDAPSITIE